MTLLSTRRVHTGRVVSLDIDTVRFPNGEVGELEMLRHPGASAVVPFLDPPGTDDPRILLIRQFRHATGGWLWEVPAGRRDGGEAPEATAHRELAEETGYTAAHLERLTTIWTTPGFTDEQIHLFRAWELAPGTTAHERDEVMELHEVAMSRAMAMVRDGTITDTKTVVALLWIAAAGAMGPNLRAGASWAVPRGINPPHDCRFAAGPLSQAGQATRGEEAAIAHRGCPRAAPPPAPLNWGPWPARSAQTSSPPRSRRRSRRPTTSTAAS